MCGGGGVAARHVGAGPGDEGDLLPGEAGTCGDTVQDAEPLLLPPGPRSRQVKGVT